MAGWAIAGAGCDCPACFGGTASGTGFAGPASCGAAAAATGAGGGADVLGGGISAAEVFGDLEVGAEIAGAPPDANAGFAGRTSSDCFGLAPSRPISTTILRSSRNARTSGVPLSVKTTATESKSTSDSIDFSVGGS